MTFEDYLGECRVGFGAHEIWGDMMIQVDFPKIGTDRVAYIKGNGRELTLAELVNIAKMNYNNRTNKNED